MTSDALLHGIDAMLQEIPWGAGADAETKLPRPLWLNMTYAVGIVRGTTFGGSGETTGGDIVLAAGYFLPLLASSSNACCILR